ncbi:MAG: hypothetical protein L0387_44395 [Acidobacteria bacterium]|nr:hypothetical protein [Acidobacteriota bacterium]
MSNPNSDNVRQAYSEVCSSYHAIADFRAKLLGLLPLASGAGIFLLLESKDTDYMHLAAVGLFGFLTTLGLFFYELRGIQHCNALIASGKELERELLSASRELRGCVSQPPEGPIKVCRCNRCRMGDLPNRTSRLGLCHGRRAAVPDHRDADLRRPKCRRF